MGHEVQLTMQTIKRPLDVWLRVLLGTVAARLRPTLFDPGFRGRPTWALAFRMARESWGYNWRARHARGVAYNRRHTTTDPTHLKTRWVMRSHDGSLWATLWVYTAAEVGQWQMSKPVRPLRDDAVSCGTLR